MQTGKIIRKFSAKNGLKVTLRTPRWEDLDNLSELINSLVEEGSKITRNEKVTREAEIDWLSKTLASLEKDEPFFLVVEVDASYDIHPLRSYEKHVGVLGIVIKNEYRDVGIGTEIMKTLIGQSYKIGLKILTLTVFATNKRAIHVYEKVGFVQTDVIPKKHFTDGKYIDEIIMTKVLM